MGMADPIRVLHVDDEPDFLDLTADVLERQDDRFVVETATSGREALDRGLYGYDCIVSDYDMSGLDGIEFLEAVREEHPDVPFLLFTGKGSEAVASEAISAGVTDYLQKRSGLEQYELLANRITNAVEQRRATERATEQHRISTVVRKINRALVDATSRDEINQRVCDILAGGDPYLFAWIGTVDPETDRIEPQAAAGIEDGYLDEITVTADESRTGQGPGGTAIREGRVAVSQNIPEDEAFDHWRAEALERGYRAAAAIPLQYEDTRYGLLGVYADRPNAFDDSERSLLSELGDTIAHAYRRIDVQREYENQYRELFAEAPVMFVFTRNVDGEPIIDDCNRRFAETLGYTREELRETPLADVYTDRSAETLLGGGYDRALSGEFVREQRELRTRDGERITTLLRATPRRNTEGEIVGTHALYVDISEQLRLESLETFRDRMEFALDATDSVIFALDIDSMIGSRYGPFERLYGVESDHVGVNEAFYEQCVHPDDRERVRELQHPDSITEADEPVTCEFRTHPDRGEERWIRSSAYVSTDDEGTPQRLVGLDTDITERKRRERDLERYEAIVENTEDGVYVFDEEGRFEFVNQRVVEVSGISREAWTGEHVSIHTDLGTMTEAEVTAIEDGIRAIADGEKREVRVELSPDVPHGLEYLELRLTPLETDEKENRVIGFSRDITEHRERQRELQRQYDRVNDFASVVSHDLRNPLNVAHLRLDMAMEECNSEHLPPVMESLDRMVRLTDDLLTLARAEEQLDEVEPVDLAALCEKCWRTVETSEASVEIETDQTIRADPGRLKQLFENLVRNSVEHGSTGPDSQARQDSVEHGSTSSQPGVDDGAEHGSTSSRTESDDDLTVRIGDLDGGFYVADDGPGIPAEQRDELFERGYSTKQDGTGFGLSIVEGIVEAHGWEIAVTESDAGGARFEITGVESRNPPTKE